MKPLSTVHYPLSIIILFAFLFTSCFATKQTHDSRKLNKIIGNHPEWIKRTTTIHDTSIVRAVHVDTAVSVHFDTVNIVHDQLHVRLVHLHDTIFVSGNCAADTVVKTIRVPVETIVPPPLKTMSAWWYVMAAIALFMFLFFLLKDATKFRG